MRVINRTPYPSEEVRRIVLAAMPPKGRPPRVVVAMRRSRTDVRQGFTPNQRPLTVWLWVEPAPHYPQGRTARSWRHELAQNAAHESYHVEHWNGRTNGGERGADRRMLSVRRRFSGP